MNILITGASGFIGRRVVQRLTEFPKVNLTGLVRRPIGGSPSKNVVIDGLDSTTDFSAALHSQQVVIHAAARAHILEERQPNPLVEYRKVNVDGTLNLARQAATAGAKRFIFISTIGVNGSNNSKPFKETDQPKPSDPYAQSKWEAEQGLWDINRRNEMEITIIRPPLVYGPNAPGNFGTLVRWVANGFPLPLGAINNRRSLVALDSLVDLIITCIDHPAAANQVFLAGDSEDLSTTELLQGVAKAMGKPSRLVPVPAGLLMLGARFLGRRDVAQRLLGSLQVDISKAREVLGWEPPISVIEGLRRCFPERR